jgi:hypothetical protein
MLGFCPNLRSEAEAAPIRTAAKQKVQMNQQITFLTDGGEDICLDW